jgi:hypothetical protein
MAGYAVHHRDVLSSSIQMAGYAAHHRDVISGPIQMADYAAHHRDAMIATQDPTYFESGSWAVSTTPPMTQIKKSLFASFSSEKEVLPLLF